MERTRSLSLSVRPHKPDVTMDHRVKPGGDAVGSLWSILHVEFESPYQSDAPQDVPKIYAAPYVTEFQFRYNDRFNPDIFGTAISGC